MSLPVVGKAHEASAAQPFTWFVYGSSLDPEAFAAWARDHGYAPPDLGQGRPAALPGFRLAFDVVSRFWGGAVASLTEAEGETVEGLALALPGAARGMVEHKEGVISGLYAPQEVTLRLADGTEARAVAFRAAPERRLPRDAPPSPAYLDAVIRGARAAGLSAAWLRTLEALRAAR
ncbi:gamma-glutamylcyclotransferase family protein [Anaeromyxobacter dehalogenans]|uniref:Gamma-glutamylcyclotransferase n=1 Tax=Anaeromyxobacter dehalogenans (strain 2CP-C) TaxID=290397 RepID=Q2IGT7_ANADE|nr:gamma-glutamylcyclotransferase family protein [Anaeromyxobacter dehalogenans]ABC83792.1 conserved hypothetical protein [Anaeromyxobacter dehalogenans 2CP-C]